MLLKILGIYKNKNFQGSLINKGDYYYIIHPVLKKLRFHKFLIFRLINIIQKNRLFKYIKLGSEGKLFIIFIINFL